MRMHINEPPCLLNSSVTLSLHNAMAVNYSFIIYKLFKQDELKITIITMTVKWLLLDINSDNQLQLVKLFSKFYHKKKMNIRLLKNLMQSFASFYIFLLKIMKNNEKLKPYQFLR